MRRRLIRYLSTQCVLALWLVLSWPAPGSLYGQAIVFEVRGGVVASSRLVVDPVAMDGELSRLDVAMDASGAQRTVREVTASALPGPLVMAGVRTETRAGLWLESTAGWTYSDLGARGGGESWLIQTLHITHLTAGVRLEAAERFHLRGGLGRIRYGSERYGLFAQGPVTATVLEAGAGTEWTSGAVLLSLDLLGQVHSFGTPVFRLERGVDGNVFRLALTAGVVLGGGDNR